MMLFDVGIDEPIDLAITHLALPTRSDGGMQQSFGEGEKFTLRAVVTAPAKVDGATLTCKIGPHKLADQDQHVLPGEQQTLTFEIDSDALKLGKGLHQAVVELQPANDLLPFNNQRFVTFEIRAMPKVLVLADDARRSALFAKALRALRYQVNERTMEKSGGFNDYAAVFLVGVAAPTEPLWTKLADFVQLGGGVAIIPGEEIKLGAYNTEAAKKVMPAVIEAKGAAEPGAVWNLNLLLANLDHPFLKRFQSWFIDDWDITRNPRRAKQFWKAAPFDRNGVIVSYDNDVPAIVERVAAKEGKVVLLTTPMDDEKDVWNNYYQTGHSFYPALTLMCARYLCPDAENPTLNYVFGQQPPRVRRGLEFPKYLLTGPAATEEITFNDKGLWVGERLPKAGNYAVAGVNEEKPFARFSINVPGEESDLAKAPISDLEAVLGKDAVVPQDRKTSLPATLHWDEPIDLFPFLMLAFLFILALENLLANKFYRQEPNLA